MSPQTSYCGTMTELNNDAIIQIKTKFEADMLEEILTD
jgi:hypothetical protein